MFIYVLGGQFRHSANAVGIVYVRVCVRVSIYMAACRS